MQQEMATCDYDAKSSGSLFNFLTDCNFIKFTDLNSFEMGQVLLNLASQLGGNLEDGVVVLHHEGHQFGGQQLVQVHLIYRAQNAGREHLHHLDGDHNKRWIRNQLPATLYSLHYNNIGDVCSESNFLCPQVT